MCETKGLYGDIYPNYGAAVAAAGSLNNYASSPETRVERLRRLSNESNHLAKRYERALEILNRHPEFEEFIELQSLLPL
jgi:hypothetical protein